jgi:uncharacterized protein YcaQ
VAGRTASRASVQASSRNDKRRDDVALSIVDARRIALAAQGFGRVHRGATDLARLSSVIDRIGVLQIDSVNVLVRSQELPIFARIGDHDRSVVAKAVTRGKMFEYWVHEASLAPVELHPFMRWRMARPHPWLGNYYSRNRALVERLYRRVRDDGPLKAADVSMRDGKKGSWWDWDDAKSALEYLFYAGRLTTRARDNDFSRTYDLPERVLPARVLDARTPSELVARRELLMRAIDHTGVATFGDLADYHRQKPRLARAALESLVDDGSLRLAHVEGWDETAYVARRLAEANPIDACALLSPFDSLVWNRERNERLFGFHYRIEIYTPKPKRRFGYYVLPVLCDERLVGRLDMKADRHARALRVEGAYVEEGVAPKNVVEPIAQRLAEMARWLALDRVVVARRGSLAAALAANIGRRSRQ